MRSRHERDSSGEDALVRAIRALTGDRRRRAAGVRVGIGDDCAVLEPTARAPPCWPRPTCSSRTSTSAARWAEPADIGWKALAVNLSDIAAMGGRPRWALVALACPAGTTAEEIEAFYEGALALAR